MVADFETEIRFMLHIEVDQIHVHAGVVICPRGRKDIAEKLVARRARGIARRESGEAGREVLDKGRNADRGNAAVVEAAVVVMLVAKRHEDLFQRLPGERRIDAIALHLEVVAIAAGLLVKRIQAHGELIVDRLPHIRRHAPAAEAAACRLQIADRLAIGFLGDAVDDSAAAAAAEGERARAFENLNRLDVVEVTVVFGVVADAVPVEIGRGVLAADRDSVLVAFATRHRHAGHIGQRLLNAEAGAVFQLLLSENGDRLWNVDDRRVGLGRGRRAARDIADNAARAVAQRLLGGHEGSGLGMLP
jgi:hypothetical protein